MSCISSQPTKRHIKNNIYVNPCSRCLIHQKKDGYGMCEHCLDKYIAGMNLTQHNSDGVSNK